MTNHNVIDIIPLLYTCWTYLNLVVSNQTTKINPQINSILRQIFISLAFYHLQASRSEDNLQAKEILH